MTLAEILHSVPPRLAAITEEEASRRDGNGRWSKKEVLGHLIDSAANNHQRFVRAQLAPHVDLPGYQQESWVRLQSYQTEPWSNLIQLWLQFNRHLAHVIANVEPAALQHTISLDGRAPVTLGFVIDDYVRHLEHHLSQIL
jgi:DinB superfamily